MSRILVDTSFVLYMSWVIAHGSLVDSMEYLSNNGRILVEMPDGSRDLMDCPFNLICGLVITKGISSICDLDELFKYPVMMDDIDRAVSIVKYASSCRNDPGGGGLVDIGRVMRDAKYAVQVQEMITHDTIGQLGSFRGQVLALTLNSLGCRVIQKIIDVADLEDALNLVHPELTSRVLECAIDVNGNHVIQKCIDKLPSEECRFIVDAIINDPMALGKLSAHCYGCRVVQRLISRCSIDFVEPILEALCSDPILIATLSEDVFGNYVMQHALEFGREIDRERICICLASMNIIELGCSKFASNVLEKAVRSHQDGTLATRLVINAMLTAVDPVTEEQGILTLMKDRYGNYVVRAVIELNRPEFAEEVALVKNIILSNVHQLKKYTFSWHLVERLYKMSRGSLFEDGHIHYRGLL